MNWLLAQLDGAAWLEATIQAAAKSLILEPGLFLAQTISSLWPTRGTIRDAQDSFERTYSSMILTSTRFRRSLRSPRTPGPAIPRGLKRSASTCQRLRPAQSSRRGGRWSRRPPRLRLTAHHAQHSELPSALGARLRPCPSWTGVLSGAVAHPASGPAWSIGACGANFSSHTS